MRHKLGDICKFINGGSWAVSDYSDTGYPVLKVSNFQKDTFKFDEISYLKNENFPKYKKNQLQLHDLVIATVGSHPNLVNSSAGRSVSISKSIVGYLLNQNAVCLRTKNKNILNQRYLTYLGKTDYFQHFIQQRGKGAANQMRIAIGGIKDFEFDFPNIETQRKIATILSAYDDLIENNRRRITLLEEQAQLTYEEWFVRMRFPGFEKVEWDEELGLPMGWRKVKMKDCCQLTMGQSPKSIFYNYKKEGLPFHQGVKDYGFRFPKNSTWSTEGKRMANEDDILFSVRAPVGRLNIAIEKIILGRGLAAIRHKKEYNGFLFYQLQKIFFEDDIMGGGAIFNSITKKDIENVKILHATDELLISFNEFASNINEHIKNLTRQNRLLQEGRDILLPRLMLGLVDSDMSSG